MDENLPSHYHCIHWRDPKPVRFNDGLIEYGYCRSFTLYDADTDSFLTNEPSVESDAERFTRLRNAVNNLFANANRTPNPNP